MSRRLLALALTGLTACSSEPKLDPNSWTCESLVQPVIDMSKEKDNKILELTNPTEHGFHSEASPDISCTADAETSNGDRTVDYEARISAGEHVILQYSTR